jgi:hypothetical protein
MWSYANVLEGKAACIFRVEAGNDRKVMSYVVVEGGLDQEKQEGWLIRAMEEGVEIEPSQGQQV